MKKLLIVVNVDWAFISHRLIIAEHAVRNGWEVYVATNDTGRAMEIIDKGIKFIPVNISRSGTNILQEIRTIFQFYNIYSQIRPDVVHHVTFKPVIYGSIISKLLGIKGTLNAISGLGYNFTSNRRGFVQNMMIILMKFGFRQKNLAVIFQNEDDYREVLSLGVINKNNKINFIKGSGVNLDLFRYTPPVKKEKLQILLPTRMLWDKGVAELREASNILKHKYRDSVMFILSGIADNDNNAGVSDKYLKDWEEPNYVKWIGFVKDMPEVYSASDIVVLPSYREGIPKSLIEACAAGRPIVTTNSIGCKECVDEGINGYKVPIKSTVELAVAIEKLILSESDRLIMGKKSREKAEKEFSEITVVNHHLKIYNNLLNIDWVKK
ncbi:glycosyltransferase family 4 protein [Litoribaculum gwangyangense]|uniref:Glycosyltransferase family 4 protein n=1 Tax=Litoribaculum gwangyangense TaxID=1130722 RepID=A0ABP9C3H2_9FLAO